MQYQAYTNNVLIVTYKLKLCVTNNKACVVNSKRVSFVWSRQVVDMFLLFVYCRCLLYADTRGIISLPCVDARRLEV